MLTIKKLKKFFKKWKKLNLFYKRLCYKGHLNFPEPLQKEIIMSFYDTNLKLANKPPYDFQGNVELKSSTTKNGCTPFSATQNNCSRIIYMEITGKIKVYEIGSNEVTTINGIISSSSKNKVNITLDKYLTNAKETIII